MKKSKNRGVKLLSVILTLALLCSVLIPSTAFAVESDDKVSYHLTVPLGDYVYADAAAKCYYVLAEDKINVVDAGSDYHKLFYDFKASSADPDEYKFFDFYAIDDKLYYLYQCGANSYICVVNFTSRGVFKNTLRFACTSVMCTKSGDIIVYSPLNSGMVFVIKANGTTANYKVPSPILDFYGEDNDGNIYYRQSHGVTFAKYDGNSFTESNSRISDLSGDYSNRSMPVEVLNDSYIADYRGGLYTLSNGVTKKVLDFERASGSETSYPGAGTSMVFVHGTNYIIGLGSGNTLAAYDYTTGEMLSSVPMVHKVYSITQFGSQILALEKDKTDTFCEVFNIDDLISLEAEVFHLNSQSVYEDRSAAEVAQHYSEAVSDYDRSSKLLKNKGSEKAPYAASEMNDNAQQALLKFSNYQRWLAGLTPYQTGNAGAKDCAAKGAILLAASPVQGHFPPRPYDMDQDFYNVAYTGTGGNLAYHSSINTIADGIEAIRGLTNDTENLSNKETVSEDGRYYQGYNTPGHRITFMQRGGKYVSYGSASGVLVQYTERAQSDPNYSGTFTETDNNQAAYAWPAPGVFPLEEVDLRATWTVNLNTDVVNIGSKALKITITDLVTGEEFVRDTVMHDKDGQREGYSITNYWGKIINFTPPKADSYNGRSYHVKIEHLINKNGMPAAIEYTINMISYSDTFIIDNEEYVLDENAKLVRKTQQTEPSTEPATEPATEPSVPASDPTEPTDPGTQGKVTYLVGDVNADGKVNGADAGMLNRYTSGWEGYDSKIKNYDAADINRDGKVNGADAGLLNRYTSGWTTVSKYFIEITK